MMFERLIVIQNATTEWQGTRQSWLELGEIFVFAGRNVGTQYRYPPDDDIVDISLAFCYIDLVFRRQKAKARRAISERQRCRCRWWCEQCGIGKRRDASSVQRNWHSRQWLHESDGPRAKGAHAQARRRALRIHERKSDSCDRRQFGSLQSDNAQKQAGRTARMDRRQVTFFFARNNGKVSFISYFLISYFLFVFFE